MRGPVSRADAGAASTGRREIRTSVQVDPFKRPDIARRYDGGGWPALVVALPDGRIFARAVDIPPANVEPYLRRLHTAYEEKRESNRRQGTAHHPSKG